MLSDICATLFARNDAAVTRDIFYSVPRVPCDTQYVSFISLNFRGTSWTLCILRHVTLCLTYCRFAHQVSVKVITFWHAAIGTTFASLQFPIAVQSTSHSFTVSLPSGMQHKYTCCLIRQELNLIGHSLIFFNGSTAPRGPRPPHCSRLHNHTQTHHTR